jgi:exo-1,4-beta-D-glucosaminidase
MDIPKGLDVTSVYFIDLRLTDLSTDEEVDQNFYWLSTQADIPDFTNTKWFYTPIKQYADFTALRQIPATTLISRFQTRNDKGEQIMEVSITNNGDNIAFFIELQVVGESSGEVILPVFWEDNYLSLLPGESRSLEARYSMADLKKDRATLAIYGWNIK